MEVNKVLVLGNENFLTLLKNTAHMHYVLSSTHNDALNKLRETQFDYVVILYTGNSAILNFCEKVSQSQGIWVFV